MSRVQLALNVPDIDEAVEFYSKLFATTPAKTKPGYANFEVADPPFKLVLFEATAAKERLNHLGVEVDGSDHVREHERRLEDEGVDADDGSGTCCFAEQDKVWVTAPDGPWEIYAKLADSNDFGPGVSEIPDMRDGVLCCAPTAEQPAGS